MRKHFGIILSTFLTAFNVQAALEELETYPYNSSFLNREGLPVFLNVSSSHGGTPQATIFVSQSFPPSDDGMPGRVIIPPRQPEGGLGSSELGRILGRGEDENPTFYIEVLSQNLSKPLGQWTSACKQTHFRKDDDPAGGAAALLLPKIEMLTILRCP